VLHARDPEHGTIERMSKSRGNVVAPESVVEVYGADVTRLHLLFMGPFEADTVWDVEEDGVTPQYIEGVRRFVRRVWRLCVGDSQAGIADPPQEQKLLQSAHQALAKATEEIEGLRFNTAISALMVLSGHLEANRASYGDSAGFRTAREMLLRMLAPFAPFVTEKLWQRLGLRAQLGSIHRATRPELNASLLIDDQMRLAVLVNNRVRDHITLPAATPEASVREAALQTDAVWQVTADRDVQRIIVVPGRLVNIVVA
jgi:leucyl-tRNA synthetase